VLLLLLLLATERCSIDKNAGCRGRYADRTSSAHWDADKLTLVEKRAYRKHMGYERQQSLSTAAAK